MQARPLSKTPVGEVNNHASALLNPAIHQEVIYEKVKAQRKVGGNTLLGKKAQTRPQSVDMSAQRTAVHSRVGSVDLSRCSSSRAGQRAEARPMRGHGMNLSMVEFNTPLDVPAPASRASGKIAWTYPYRPSSKIFYKHANMGHRGLLGT